MAKNKRRSTAQRQRAKARQQQQRATTPGSPPPSAAKTAAPRREDRAPKGRPPARRRSARRTQLAVIGGVIAVVAVMAILFATRNSTSGGGAGATDAGIAKVTNVSPATLEKVGVPSDIKSVPPLPPNVPPVQSGGLPVMTYVGAEYCPYCAAERWPVTVALGRFGTFSDLGTTTSGPKPEPYPDTPTVSYHGSSYTSDYLDFSSVETGDRFGNPLDTPTDQQQQLLDTYNTEQYTGSNGGIPFVMVDNLYAWAGTTYDPGVLEGLTFDQIANQLDNPDSKVAQQIGGAANQITAMICQATGNQPAEVCSAPYIQQAQAALQGQ